VRSVSLLMFPRSWLSRVVRSWHEKIAAVTNLNVPVNKENRKYRIVNNHFVRNVKCALNKV
jgi:hypothetical protein